MPLLSSSLPSLLYFCVCCSRQLSLCLPACPVGRMISLLCATVLVCKHDTEWSKIYTGWPVEVLWGSISFTSGSLFLFETNTSCCAPRNIAMCQQRWGGRWMPASIHGCKQCIVVWKKKGISLVVCHRNLDILGFWAVGHIVQNKPLLRNHFRL